MTEPDFSPQVSVARLSDYEAVKRLCRKAVGPDDYVLRILRDVISDKGLFLAWIGDQLVGMTRFDRCIDGSGWLSMARTDPDWRGRGVARSIQLELARRATRRGIRTMRLWTLSTNHAAIHSCERGGFHRMCEAVHMSHSFRSKARFRGKYSDLTSGVNAASGILKSSFLSRTRGYFAYKRHFVKADKRLIERISRKGELYSDGESAFILTRPESSFHRLSSSFSILDGDPTSSMRLIFSKAKDLRVEWIGGYLPYDPHLIGAAKSNMFRVDTWGDHCFVFEKNI